MADTPKKIDTANQEGVEILTPLTDIFGHESYQIDSFYIHEKLSDIAHMHVTLRVFEPSPDIIARNKKPNNNVSKSLEKSITLKLSYHGCGRIFYGCIGRITHKLHRDENDVYTLYELTLYPKLWFQGFTKNYSIFQKKTPHHVISNILHTYGALDVSDHSQSSGRTQCDYIVQYGESYLNFVSRLMAESGFFYQISHDINQSTLKLYDSVAQLPSLIDYEEGLFLNASHVGSSNPHTLQSLHHAYHATPHQYACADYAYITPHTRLFLKTLSDHPDPGLFYTYPGYFQHLNEGESCVKNIRTQHEWRDHILHGRSTACMIQPGYKCMMSPDESSPQKYTIIEAHHFWARSPHLHASHHVMENGASSSPLNAQPHPQDVRDTYYNYFTCIPFDVPFAVTPQNRPVAPAHQSARVVGPKGEDIYTDEMGRIKIQFFWDQVGQFDEHSSCWVRVCQNLSGAGFGGYMIPRVGSEVIVSFLDHDINQPIVIGCVYNGDHPPPLDLPGEKEHHIFKSQSPRTIPVRYNEWRIVDTPYDEKIYIRAQKNYTVDVMDGHYTRTLYQGNYNHTLNQGDETHTLKQGHFSKTLEQGNYTLNLTAGQITHNVGTGSIHHTVHQGDYNVTLDNGAHTLTLAQGDSKITLNKGAHTIDIQQGDLNITLSQGACHIYVSGAISLRSDENIDLSGKIINISARDDLNMNGKKITLKGEKMNIEMDEELSIKGKTVGVEATGELSLKGNPLVKSGEA